MSTEPRRDASRQAVRFRLGRARHRRAILVALAVWLSVLTGCSSGSTDEPDASASGSMNAGGAGAGNSAGAAATGAAGGALGGSGASGAGTGGGDSGTSGAGTPDDGGPDAAIGGGDSGGADAGAIEGGAGAGVRDAGATDAEAGGDSAVGDAAADAAGDGEAGTSAPGLLVSTSGLSFEEDCGDADPQTFTITNTSDVSITWTTSAVGDAVLFVDPSTSTLLPGEVVPVTVRAEGSAAGYFNFPPVDHFESTLSIDSDFPEQVTPTVGVSLSVLSIETTPPPAFDFGLVAVGSRVTIDRSDNGTFPFYTGVGSSNSAFTVLRSRDGVTLDWLSVTFSPQVVGPQTAILTRSSAFQTLCPPNSSLATGTGFLDITCTSVLDGSPCAPAAQCFLGECSIAHLSAVPALTGLTRGVELQEILAYGTPADTLVDPLSSFTAEIDWGDGSVSAGEITGGFDFSVTGTHVYADAGTWPITVTLHTVEPSPVVAIATLTAEVGD